MLVGLEFNGPVNTIKVMWSRSVYQTTLFLGRLRPQSGQSVVVHILLPETDNFPRVRMTRKYFMINLHESILLDRVGMEPTTSWSPVRMASHC